MNDDYRGLAIFVAVVDAGSFSEAARRLSLSTSVVSHHVNKLEDRFGVSLLFRSTRSLALTSEGSRILEAARRMVSAGEEALDILADISDEPVGALRIAMPIFGERSAIHQSVWAFARTYPLVSITVHGSDEQVDIVKDGFDVAIRLGDMRDSALKSRRIGDFQRILVAAPSYLARRPSIESIADLQACDFISYAMLPSGMALEKGRERVDIKPGRIRLEVNSVAAMKSALLAGCGVQRIPLCEIQDELENGSLVRLLPDWSLPLQFIYAVWPAVGLEKQLTRRFIDFVFHFER